MKGIQNNQSFMDSGPQLVILTITLFVLFLSSTTISSEYIHSIGMKVGSKNPSLDFQLNLVIYWLVGFLLIFLPIEKTVKSVLVYAYIFRFIILNTLSIYYLYSYSSDKGAMVISLDEMHYFNVARTVPVEEIGYIGSGLISRINFYLSYFLPTNYFLFRSIFGFISFAGLIMLWAAVSQHYKEKFLGLLIAILFFPSLAFWSLNMGKEAIVLFGLGIYTIGHVRLLKSYQVSNFLMIFLGFLIMGIIRPWMVFILSPSIGLLFLLDKRVSSALKVTLILVGFLVFPYFLNFLISGVIRGGIDQPAVFYNFDSIFQIMNTFISGGVTVEESTNPLFLQREGQQITSLFQLLNPMSIFSALFRPFPLEAGGAIGIIVGIENILLFITTFIVIVSNFYKRVQLKEIHLLLIINIFVWSCLYGALLDFNWGYHFRQKVIIVPFMLSLIYLLYLKQKKT